MPGLVPGIHVFILGIQKQVVDGRDKPGHDGWQAMRLRVDHAADAVYLNLTDRPVEDSEEVADGIVVDYDDEGRIVGIEILDASRRAADPTALRQFSFEET